VQGFTGGGVIAVVGQATMQSLDPNGNELRQSGN
jgi:hypothetical protein